MRIMTSALVTGTLITGAVLSTLSACGVTTVVTPGAAVPAYTTCRDENGEHAEQEFPCLWDGASMGNGHGSTYILTAPGFTGDIDA